MADGFGYVSNRLRFLVVVMGFALVAGLWLLPQGAPVTGQVSATVLEVNEGTATGLRSGQSVTLVTLRVRLETGEETRVQVLGRPPAVGDAVMLLESAYPDGKRRYRLLPEHGLAD